MSGRKTSLADFTVAEREGVAQLWDVLAHQATTDDERARRLRASHNCGTKCHVPALEEGVETAETPGDGFRAGWLVAA